MTKGRTDDVDMKLERYLTSAEDDNDDFPYVKMELTRETFPTVRAMAENMPGGFFIYQEDEIRKLLYINRAALKIYGCRTLDEFKELTGYTFQGMVHEEDFHIIQSSIDEQIEKDHEYKMDHVVYRIRRKDGRIRWVDDYGHFSHSVDYGDIYYVFISDITEKHEAYRAERELRVNEAKNAFLFNISHDIRTPMNAIMGFMELAKKHIDDIDLAIDYMEKVEASSSHLLSLIDDMLEMSAIDTGRIELHPVVCNLREEVETVVNMLKLDASEGGKRIEIDVPEQIVEIDSLRLRRILSNLIENAVKFTNEGGSIKVAARCLRMSDSGYGRYEIKVSDTGMGISEDFRERIFDAFERERTSKDARLRGTGIGLSIVKGLLDAMGGSISLKSEKNVGSIFTVEIPMKLAVDISERTRAVLISKSRHVGGNGTGAGISSRSEDPLYRDDSDTDSLREAKGKKMVSVQGGGNSVMPGGLLMPTLDEHPNRKDGRYRILLVDDIEINRIFAETVLQDAGFEVESVRDGAEALEAVRNNPGYYDLVLMDIQMPIMDGYEATRAIRALNRKDTDRIPILALGANAMEKDGYKSMKSGMNLHIAKPFDKDNLVRTIQYYMDSRPSNISYKVK